MSEVTSQASGAPPDGERPDGERPDDEDRSRPDQPDSAARADAWATMADADSAYIERVVAELYAFEIDRKDKILTSLRIVSTPTTLLIGASTYLINSVAVNTSDYLGASSDIMVWLSYVALACVLVNVGRVFLNFHKLLSGDAYALPPPADEVLNTLLDIKRLSDEAGSYFDGAVMTQGREVFVPRYAAAARANARTSDLRLEQRQTLFRATSYGLLAAGAAVAIVAIHRQWPHIWHVHL